VDNGIGFPPGLDFRNTDSLGLRLVTALADQLDGTITLDLQGGTRFTIQFEESPDRNWAALGVAAPSCSPA